MSRNPADDNETYELEMSEASSISEVGEVIVDGVVPWEIFDNRIDKRRVDWDEGEMENYMQWSKENDKENEGKSKIRLNGDEERKMDQKMKETNNSDEVTPKSRMNSSKGGHKSIKKNEEKKLVEITEMEEVQSNNPLSRSLLCDGSMRVSCIVEMEQNQKRKLSPIKLRKKNNNKKEKMSEDDLSDDDGFEPALVNPHEE
ncbi:hypothetical protein PENTCL1PPCAC_12094, partial [Pristionchus entomophagus]